MPEETAISLKNRTDCHMALQLNRPHLITRPPIQRKNCWNDKDNFMVNIFLLEYVLFTVANNNNIPMIYEDYDWEDYKKIIIYKNIDVQY